MVGVGVVFQSFPNPIWVSRGRGVCVCGGVTQDGTLSHSSDCPGLAKRFYTLVIQAC